MSVCVVARYPWSAITELVKGATPGAIVCTDTRVSTSDGRAYDSLVVKQGPVSQSSLVCFTSSHVEATRHALKAIYGARTLKEVGAKLREVHAQYGGRAEVLAAVWKPPAGLPRMVELMPPEYKPRRVYAAIAGIGHAPTLEWFRQNFHDDPRPSLPKPLPQKALDALVRQFGPDSLPPTEPRFPLGSAALSVAAALSEGIEQAGDISVGLPIQLTIVQAGKIEKLNVAASLRNDLSQFVDITPTGTEKLFPLGAPSRTKRDKRRSQAVRLFR